VLRRIARSDILFLLTCLYQVPGVPLIYGLRNALFLESPSAFQRQYVKTSEEERLHMTEKEYKILKDRVMNRLRNLKIPLLKQWKMWIQEIRP